MNFVNLSTQIEFGNPKKCANLLFKLLNFEIRWKLNLLKYKGHIEFTSARIIKMLQ